MPQNAGTGVQKRLLDALLDGARLATRRSLKKFVNAKETDATLEQHARRNAAVEGAGAVSGQAQKRRAVTP